MSQNHLPSQAAHSKVENSNLFAGSSYPSSTATERRHYSFDADSEISPFAQTRFSMDYDQTEGLGGLSVSSYDSIEDERTSIDARSYHYHPGDKSLNYPLPDQMVPTYPHHSMYPSVPYQIDDLGHPGNLTPSDVSSSISPPNGQLGNTRYSIQPPSDRIASALSIEEQSRMVAEEDKRRRNTAASARFRVKKKQREQALERTVREATELNATLEARVAQLEMENRWLKNLLTEKHENTVKMPPPPDSSNTPPVSQSTSSTAAPAPKNIQPKKGVGTDI
ncbi:positive-acting master sulfur regulatory [Paecilomyces variotii]|uniref:Positive-acting master sulfur regulatory n=1 Tax=Byssochlamys spectabilis TaxID=264951 RepID=A0A443HQU6_BYSSP|nr:positive-acting master sulfur regulatory [Paecilomyces variotii]RWQ94208.1 positive-acting master sulfur regulatory [Paecilomyces variotii]